MKDIALQLYSVREDTAKDFYQALKRAAELGFTGVEFAGYGDVPAETMRSWLSELGLRAVSTHTNVLANLDAELTYLQTIGANHIVLPYAGFESREAVLRLAEEMNAVGQTCAENGFTLSYHNHAHEFAKTEDGTWLLDIFYENTDPRYVKMQLDVCWATVGGADPVAYLKKYEDRCCLVHCKEVKSIDPYEGTAIGEGIVDFPGIYRLLGDSRQYIVEQETIAMDCWEGLRRSVNYLSTL